jgi:hypothetical protein
MKNRFTVAFDQKAIIQNNNANFIQHRTRRQIIVCPKLAQKTNVYQEVCSMHRKVREFCNGAPSSETQFTVTTFDAAKTANICMIGSCVQKLYSMMSQTKMLLIHNGLTLEEYFWGVGSVFCANV